MIRFNRNHLITSCADYEYKNEDSISHLALRIEERVLTIIFILAFIRCDILLTKLILWIRSLIRYIYLAFCTATKLRIDRILISLISIKFFYSWLYRTVSQILNASWYRLSYILRIYYIYNMYIKIIHYTITKD